MRPKGASMSKVWRWASRLGSVICEMRPTRSRSRVRVVASRFLRPPRLIESPPRQRVMIGMAGVDVAHRADGVVGADLFADAAAAAVVLDRMGLADHRHRREALLRLGEIPFGEDHAPPLDLGRDGPEGAGRHAGAAQGAAAGVVADLPGQIVGGDVVYFHCFHRWTSRLLSITTISRSLG